MNEKPNIRYHNTDLDLVAPISLEPLISHFQSAHIFNLHHTQGDHGLWYATFETDASFEEPDPNMAFLLNAIETATGKARACWEACTNREFNVGYDCGDEPWSFNQGISNETLRCMAACGATFRLTIYPYRPDPVDIDE